MGRCSDFSTTDLVRLCAASKDEEAWGEFIQRFHPVIAAATLRTARQWCDPPRSLLDDLIQDTYLKLCDHDCRLLVLFRPQHGDSIFGFLKVVASNVVHDHFKSARAAKRGAGQPEMSIEPDVEPIPINSRSNPPDSFETVSQRIQLEHLDRVLMQVAAGPEQAKKRTIFWLRHRQGLTASEIAAIPSIGLTTEGVESVLARLAAMIRNHMANSAPHREVKVLSRKSRSRG